MKRLIRSFILVVTITLGITLTAKAHSALVRSMPEAGEVLRDAPTEIVLEFTEELDPGSSRVDLFDVSGQVILPGPGVIDPDSPLVLRLPIASLPDGVYSAVWRARSAVDGHTTVGSVGFSVGESSPPASLLPPPGTPDPATAFPSSVETFARWLAYLSVAVAAGSLSFGFLVWRPAFRGAMNQSEASDEAVRRLIQKMTLTSLAILGVATLGFAIILAAEALELSPGRIFEIPFSQLFTGRIGLLLSVRLLLIVLLGGLVWRLPSPGTGSSRSWWTILILGGLLLLTFSLQGHGAARGSVLSVVMIWLHLAATAVWLGGLPMLFLAIRQAGVRASALVPRFSAAALVSVASLIATGIYNAFVYVGTVESLLATTYGRALIAKTGIFALLLALGTINLFFLSPRLRKEESKAPTILGRTVRLEMALGILLLLAVGVLSGVAPAFDALQASREQGFIKTATVDDVDMMVRVMPAEAGDNEIGIEFTDRRPGANNVTPEVLVRLTSLNMNMGTQQVQATSVDGLRYTARGSYFPMTGPWELEIIIRRDGFFDVRQAFELEIPGNSSP